MAKKKAETIETVETFKVTNCDLKPIIQQPVELLIVELRGVQVMLDKDIALIYGVETKVLNQAVRRNLERFPADFMFQLTEEDITSLRSQIVTLKTGRGQHSKYLPFAFTESGVAMLSGVLKSPRAVEANIMIMRAFTAMRRFMVSNAHMFNRIEAIEYNQLALKKHQDESDQKIDEILDKLEQHQLPLQGIFYNGQIFDAYVFVNDLIRSAKERIVLIDNYVDDTVLKRLDKREASVTATIYTRKVSEQLQVDIDTHNHQYAPIRVLTTDKPHDRFLIIDREMYLIGASIKDLGKKIFGFTKMEEPADELLKRLEE